MSSPHPTDLSARSNPRRRQRNISEDSIAVRQPVKRRKRSALTNETFHGPDDRTTNGSIDHTASKSLVNGVKGEHDDTKQVNGASLAIRDRSAAQQTQPAPWTRGEDHLELVILCALSAFKLFS